MYGAAVGHQGSKNMPPGQFEPLFFSRRDNSTAVNWGLIFRGIGRTLSAYTASSHTFFGCGGLQKGPCGGLYYFIEALP